MATEISIPESICLKKGEREDNALSSEILEANVSQLLVNKVKQLETGPNQPLEASSQVVETVNTQQETGITTDESGTFFQALSIPKVAADEHINTPESCEATTTEDQEVRKMTDIEAFTEGKTNEEPVVAIASKEAFANEQQPNTVDHELAEAIPAQTQGSIVNDIGKELEQVTDISYKDESVVGSLSTGIEAQNNEDKEPEFVKTKESVKEDTEVVTQGVETEDQGLHEGATDDSCVSTDIEHEKETIKNEEEKSKTKEAGEESGPEKAAPELSDSMVPSKKEALNMLDKDQGDSEGITSSQDAICEDIKETTGQHATTVAKQDQNERPRELIKEQIEDKSIDAQEASELSEEVKGKGEQKPEISDKKTEEKEENEKIRPGIEIEENMDQNGLLHAITTDACISTQTKSQVDNTEQEKKGEVEATQSDDDQKEKFDSPPIKEVCEDNSSEKVEHEKEQEANGLDKDQDEVGITSTQDVAFEEGMVPSKIEVLEMIEKDQCDSERITRSQDATCEDIKETTGELATVAEQDQNERPIELIKEQIEDQSIDVQEASELSEDEVKVKGEQKLEASVKKTEEDEEIEKIRPSIEIEENMDQNGLLHAINADACISTQTESQSQVNIEHEKKGEEEATQSDDCQKEMSDSPPIRDVCEDNSSEKVEHEKEQEVNGLDKDHDQNEVGITSTQDVEFEGGMVPSKKESLDTLEKDQGDGEGVLSSQDATTEADQDQNERPRELIKEQIQDKSVDANEAAIEQYEDEVKGKGEQKPEESVKKIEEEQETEKIGTSVEIEEKMDQNGVLHAITTDACISTQTKTQADTIEHDEKDEEEATQSDDGQKEKSDNPPIKEICEENGSEKVEHEKEQEVNMLDKDQDEVDITSTQDVVFEGGLQEKNHQSEDNAVSTGACISRQTEPHEETKENEEKNDEDVTESNDGNTKSSRSPVVKEICEETISEKAESNEVLKSSDSFNVVLNENEIVSKDEDQEKEQALYLSQKSQTESEVKTTKLEERHEEELIESNDSQNENSDNLSIKEVCEETDSEKVEPERVELPDSSSFELNEKAVATPNKDEVQGKEQDQVTCSEDATFIEELQGKNHEDISQEPESDMIIERSLEVDYGEKTSTVEASVEREYQGSSHDGSTTDVCVSTQTELEKGSSKHEEKAIEMEVCKDTSPENAESEARLELSDNMAQSKKEALGTLQKDQGDSEGVTSSQDSTSEDTKETAPAQYASVGADFKEQDQNERPREFLKEETEDKAVDAQKSSEHYEHGEYDKNEETPEESVKHNDQQKEQEVNMLKEDQGEDNVTSAQDVSIEEGLQEKDHHSEAVDAKGSTEEDDEEIRSAVEITENVEQQMLINTNATDVCISIQPESAEETRENEEKNNEETTGNEDGKLEKSGSPIIEELNEETVSEKVESKDGLKPSESHGIMLNANETLSKDEDQEKEQDHYVSDRGQSGGDDFTSSKNATNEDIKETAIGEHVTPVDYFEEGRDLSATPKEMIKEVEEKSTDAQEATEQCEDRTNHDVEQKEESVNEIAYSFSRIEQAGYNEEIKPSVETNEEKDVCASTKIESQEQVTKKEEQTNEIDVTQMEKSDNPLVKEVPEEIDLNMSEPTEDITPSDSSNVEINEKAITSLKNEDREKDQEVSISAEDQGDDKGTSSHHVASEEEGLQEHKGEFVITSESIDKDTEENKSSDETKEKMEEEGLLHVITTDVCSSTKTELMEETTRSEEKNDEEAIENDDDGQTKKPESPLFKEFCEVTSLENVDSEVQGGGVEAISSDNPSNEEIKETSGQHATTVANFEEGLGVSSIPKEILEEEAEHKSIEALEEVKHCDNAAVDKREQKPEESVNEPINSLISEGGVYEDEVDAGNKKKEAILDAENQADRIEDISETKDEVVSKEKMSLELGQPKEQSVEEIQACLFNTISETTEDEIKKEDRDLSHVSVEDTNDNPAKEEKCTLDHELVEEQHGRVDEISKEKIISSDETNIEPQEAITPSSSSGIPTEDTLNSEKEKAESEILPIEDLKTASKVQIPEVVTKSEDSKLKEECLISETATHVDEENEYLTKDISSDETTEIKQKTVKEECEGTNSEMAEFEEGVKLSDSSNMQITKKSITSFKDEDQKKDDEVNMSAEGQGKDNVSSSQNKVSEEEDMQEKNYHNKDNDYEFGKSKETVEEDTEESKPSVGTNEKTEKKELLHVVTTDDCSSTHTEHKEGTSEKEEENDGEATENDEVEDKSTDMQEALEQHENEAKDERGQEPEEPANSCSETIEGNIEKDEADAGNNKEIEVKLNAENQADRGEDGSEMKDEANSTEKMSTELEQPKAQSVEEIQACLTETKSEKTEDDTIEDVKFVSGVQSPEVVPMSEESKLKEESFISATCVDEEKESATNEIPNDEKSENLNSIIEENVTQFEKIGEINPAYVKRDMEEDVTQENQVNSKENCSAMVKDAILTEEVPVEIEMESGINDHEEQVVEEDNYSTELQKISAQNLKEVTHEIAYSDPVPARNPDATEVKVEAKEDISCESKVENDGVDIEPKEERILSLEDAAAIKPQVDLSNIESTAHLSESEKLATQVLESACDVQTPNVVAESADSKVKEEVVVLATDEYLDVNNVGEEPKTKTNETLRAPDTEQDYVKQAPTKSDDVKSCDLIIEEKDLTKEEHELHGELKLTSESMIEEDHAIETNPQPEQPDITSEKIISDQTLESNLEDTSEKHLEDEKRDIKEDVTLAPENEIKSIEYQNETTKNVILTDDVAKETLNESGNNKVIEQISEEDDCPKELNNPSAPHQKELENKIEYSTLIPAGNTETTEVKAESHMELKNIQAAENLCCLSKSYSTENEKESPDFEFEKKEKDEELIPEVQTPESILQMEMKQEHPETTNDTCETLISGVSSEKKLASMVPLEASTNLTNDLLEDSPKLLPEEQDQKNTTTSEKIEDNIHDEEGTVVPMYSSTSTKEVACLSNEKNGEIRVSTINSEIDEDKKNCSGDLMNIEREAVQPQERISDIKFVDPPSDSQIREQEFMHSGSQEPSEDNALLSQSDKKTEDPVNLQSAKKDIIQEVDKRFEEAYISHVQKQEKDFDHEGTNTEAAIPIEDVRKADVELKSDMDATADQAEKGVLKEDMHFESTCDGSKTTEEVSEMKKGKFELDSPVTVTPGTVAIEDLEISPRSATDDLIMISHAQAEIQHNEVSDCTVDEQSANKQHQNESTESRPIAGKVNAPQEQGEPIAKSLIAETAEDLKSTKASGTEPQCSSETFKEDKIKNDEKEKFETTEPAKILFADVLHEPTKGNSEVAQNLIGERELVVTKDQRVDKEEIGGSEEKTDEENEEDEEDNEDNQKMGSCSDAPVMVEASKDMDPKVHKKSHNILSGVGSKVKHSIAKVKKAITGKSSNSKPASPKEKDQVFA